MLDSSKTTWSVWGTFANREPQKSKHNCFFCRTTKAKPLGWKMLEDPNSTFTKGFRSDSHSWNWFTHWPTYRPSSPVMLLFFLSEASDRSWSHHRCQISCRSSWSLLGKCELQPFLYTVRSGDSVVWQSSESKKNSKTKFLQQQLQNRKPKAKQRLPLVCNLLKIYGYYIPSPPKKNGNYNNYKIYYINMYNSFKRTRPQTEW